MSCVDELLALLLRPVRVFLATNAEASIESILQAQTETLAPLDLVATLVTDELRRRQDRLFERRHKQAGFRDAGKTLDTFDFDFNKKMNRRLDLRTRDRPLRRASTRTPSSSGRPAPARAISRRRSGFAAIQQGYRVLYREAHALVDELADAPARWDAEAVLAPSPPCRC